MKLPSMKLLAGALSLAFVAAPTQVSAGHSWGGYHWARTANPFTLKLGDNLSSNWKPYLTEASRDWNNETGYNHSAQTVILTSIVSGGTTSRRCKPTSGRLEVCNEKYGNNGWLGLATIWASGSHITQGTAKMNDSYFNTSTYNKPEWRRLVMCQEIAHGWGLAHQDEGFSNGNLGSCMDYTSNPAGPPSNEHPNQHDFDQTALIYGAHLDSTTTLSQTAQSGAEMPRHVAEHDSDDRSAWGKLIRSSKNGQVQTYMLDFGGGYRIFRHVIWIEGRGHEHRE